MDTILPATLRDSLSGRLILPGDADYDEARTVIYGGHDKHPQVIVRATSTADVVRAVGFARDRGLPLAVRSGGHSNAGHSVSDGLVIDLREMTTMRIDPADATAWAEPGVTAAAFSEAAGAHGLALGFGDAGSVCLGGIATGGGVGYLSRLQGLTLDSLIAAELVTADGRVHAVDAQNEPDLFWAIRGGGGNFGVATRMRFQLHPLPAFTGGMMILPATVETISGFMAAAGAAPEFLGAIANVMPAPPMPFLDPEQVGKLVIFAMIGVAAPPREAEAALAPIRALATPLADQVKPQPYAAMYPPEDSNYHPTAAALTMFMDHVGETEARLILEHLNASDASMRVAQLRPLGGAINRVPVGATAYAHRTSKVMVNVAAFYEGDADKAVKMAWVKEFAAALHQGDTGAYVNFLAEEGQERVRAAYPGATWDRLRRIKGQYDPQNLFRLNQNVPPEPGR